MYPAADSLVQGPGNNIMFNVLEMVKMKDILT
jgi:hypothetical protein